MRQTKRKQSEIAGRFFIYKAKGPNAQGKYHVKLRYTINRVEAIQGTGVWVLGKDWDDKMQRVKSSDLLAKVYNKKLEDFKLMVDTRILEFPSDKVLTSEIVRLMMQQDYDPNPENKKERDFLEIVSKELYYEYKKDKLAYSTYYNALQYMETFKTFLSIAIGNNTIEAAKVTERLIDDYILWRKTDRHNCNETINKSLTPIIKGIRASVGLGLVPDSLYVRVSSKYLSAEKRSLTEEDIEDQVIDYLTIDQMKQLAGMYDVVKHPRTKDYIEIFLFAFHACGLRFSDILTLQWKSVDWDRKTIEKVLYKGRVPHTIHLTDPALAILTKWKERTGKHKSVFGLLNDDFDLKDDSLMDMTRQSKARSVRTSLLEVGNKMGLKFNLRMHVARHSFVVQALERTRDIYLVSHLLAHKSIEVTQRVYAKFLPKTVETEVTSKLTFDFSA